MSLYYVSLRGGRCGLTTNKRQTLREEGTANVLAISIATKEQIEWVRSMGGEVPTKSRRATQASAAREEGQREMK